MRTSTNLALFMIMSPAEINELAGMQTSEKLDWKPIKKEHNIISASMWRIHHQRRGLRLRNALR